MNKTFTPAITYCFVFILLLLTASGCSDRTKPVTTDPVFARSSGLTEEQADARTRQLLLQKLHIDALSADTLGPARVFTKVPDQAVPLPVHNSNYPKQIEAIYQVCQDSLGHIVYLAESPFSESGDWDIVYRSYYDAQGRIFAFERTAGFFNSTCTQGALYETMIKFFDAQGQVLATEHSYQDENGKAIQNKPCDFPYNFPYEVVTDVETYCRKINLRL
jgi:hypothetical protein